MSIMNVLNCKRLIYLEKKLIKEYRMMQSLLKLYDLEIYLRNLTGKCFYLKNLFLIL